MSEKKIPFTLIERAKRGQPEASVPYILLDEVVRTLRHPLQECSIAIAWKNNWKADKDGLLVLGKMKKSTDLDKEFSEYDAVMLLNEEAWETLNEVQRKALIYHESLHIEPAEDEEAEGGIRRDDRGRIVYRYRKHNLEEFREVVEHFGTYKADIESFVRAAQAAGKPGIFRETAEA